MKYEVTIPKDGSKVNFEVIDPGTHSCKETALHVCNAFGKVANVSDKDDDQPVHQSGFVTTQ